MVSQGGGRGHEKNHSPSALFLTDPGQCAGTDETLQSSKIY